jgi:hypothetical protein
MSSHSWSICEVHMDGFYVHVPSPHCTLMCMLMLQTPYQCHWHAPLVEIVQQSYCVALGYESMMRWLVVPVASSLQQEDVG